MTNKKIVLLALLVLIVGLATVSAADSDNSTTNDNSGSDVAVDSSSSTAQATDSSTHTDSSVDKTSDASVSSSQKTDTTSQQATQKVTEKTSKNTQTTSDTTAKASSDTTVKDSSDTVAKASSDTTSQSSQSTSQSTQQTQSDSNTTNENINTINEKTVDTNKVISTDNVSSESDATVWNVTDFKSLAQACLTANSGDTINIEGSFSGAVLSINTNLTITSFSTANLTSMTFNLQNESSGSTISNLYIDNSNTGREAVNVTAGITDVTITNNTFVMNSASIHGKAFTVNSTNNVNITNNNIMMNDLKLNDTYAIGVFDSSDVIISNNSIKVNNSISLGKGIILNNTNNVNITNNNISVSALTKEMTWYNDTYYDYESAPDTFGIGVFNSSDVKVMECNIECYSTGSQDTAATLIGIAVQGSIIFDTDVSNVNIFKNNITLKEDYYPYGVTLHFNVDSSEVSFNNINIINEEGSFANGIELMEYTSDNELNYNNITLNVRDTAYGITFTGTADEPISNKANGNNIYVSSDRSRGIELYFTTDTSIVLNTIVANGNYTEGICCGATQYSNFYLNRIKVNGVATDITKDVDEIELVNTGIYFSHAAYLNPSSVSSSVYNTVQENHIYSFGNSTVFVSGSNINVTDNYLTLDKGDLIYGDNSVYNNGENNTITDNTGYDLSDSHLESETLAVTFEITQENYQDYFLESTSDRETHEVTSGGLSELVNDGDTLDIQGNITLPHNIAVDKAVNIISSTNDGMFIGDGDRIRLTIVETGSNTNITDITFYNMEFFSTAAENVTIDHINLTNVNKTGLGQDTGVFSLRDGSSNFTITNSFFHTENNDGHSTVVMGGANYLTFINNTIEGVGRVGNLFYLTTYDTGAELEDNINGYAYVVNNTFIGPEVPIDICYAICIAGTNNYFANNYINYTGNGITLQWGGGISRNNTFINNTLEGTGMGVVNATLVEGNTAKYITNDGSGEVINNIVTNTLSVTGENFTISNNTILEEGNLTLNVSNSIIENNIIESNININITGSKNTFTNQQFNGNVSYFINGSENIINNNIGGLDLYVDITGSSNTILNHDINGSAFYNITGDSNIVANNTAQSTGLSDSMLIINGSNNIFENNSLYNVFDNITKIVNATFIISNNSNNNTVRYNDLIVYDLFRGTYLAGDDCVYVTEGTTGNIVQDNYGNISKIIIPTPEEGTNYTYITYNVTSMEELISALDDIKTNGTYSEDTKYVVNLLDGDYTVTEAITWGDGTGDVKEVIINGTGQVINGNGFASTFLTIDDGYTLTFNNVTITNFTLSNSTNSILNNGNLTIYNSILDNAGLIGSDGSTDINPKFNTIMINNTNITNTAILGYGAIMNITNSMFYDTDLSSQSMALINNTYGNLTFLNNVVSNITSTNVIFAQNFNIIQLFSTNFIENNEFSDLHSTELDLNVSNAVYNANDVAGTFMNNTFINGVNISVVTNYGITYNMNNHYINCSLPTVITGIVNSSVTTEDYTNTVTVESDGYGAIVSEGQIVVYINDVEYKSFDVINGTSLLNIENSALDQYKNNITLKYTISNNDFTESNTTFVITNINNGVTMEYNVTSFEELKQALEDIKTSTDDILGNVINLLEGEYTVTESLSFENVANGINELTINGNNQTINLNGNTFITVAEGYTLTINNITIQDNEISNENAIDSKGNLTIADSTFINTIIHNEASSINVTDSNFSNTVFKLSKSIANISNNNFYDTDLTKFSDISGLIYYEATNLTFENNNVNNVTGNDILLSHSDRSEGISNSFIYNNTFANTDKTILKMDIDSQTWRSIQRGRSSIENEIINNTFINSTYDGKLFEGNTTNSSNYTKIQGNTYENCNIGLTIENIPDTSITTQDYTTTITVSADSLYNTTINGQVIVSIDGTNYKTFDVVDGQSNITIENSALNLANNTIQVTYIYEDGTTSNITQTFTITLAEDMIIRIPEGTLYSGDTITLTTQVAVNGTLATDGYVIFKVNGKTVKDENGNTIMAYVDENGIASINYTIPDTYSNEYNITAIYSGSSGIVRTNTTLTTTLKTATITVEQITAKAGQTVTLRAYITDQNGNAVTTGKLIFKLNGKTLKDANGNTLYATIVNGVATLVYTIPDNYSAKDYILTAVYQGTGFERSEANSTLTLTKSTPTIIPDSTVFGTNNTITINQGTESVNIKATIIDPETNAPINTTTVVTIKINDKTVTQQYVTDGQIDMTIYTSSFKNPEYNITVVVGENSQYARTSYDATLEIVSPTSLKTDTNYNGTLEIVTPTGLETSNSYNGTLLVKED